MRTQCHLPRHRKLAFIGALAVLVLGGRASAQVGLGLTPMREDLALNPGSTRSGVLTLNNDCLLYTSRPRILNSLRGGQSVRAFHRKSRRQLPRAHHP